MLEVEGPNDELMEMMFQKDGHRFLFLFDLNRVDELIPILEDFAYDESLPFCWCNVDEFQSFANRLIYAQKVAERSRKVDEGLQHGQ